jgi:hypothetical protein
MPRRPTRPLFLVLLLLGLTVLPPAAALPLGTPGLSAAERPEASAGLFSQLWSLFSALLSENGSILEPNGANGENGPGLEPNGANGDNGSILDPDG